MAIYNRPPRALTITETCVALMASTGLRDREMAMLLDTTEDMIGWYLQAVLTKTGCQSKHQLACWYASRHLGKG